MGIEMIRIVLMTVYSVYMFISHKSFVFPCVILISLQSLSQRLTSRLRAQALAADRVDERLLQLPAATGYGDRHGAHPLHLRRPLDSDDFDGWAAGTHGTATAQAADADGLGATDRARARARALGAQMRPAGMSSEQIHVDAPMLRFSKSAGRGGAR